MKDISDYGVYYFAPKSLQSPQQEKEGLLKQLPVWKPLLWIIVIKLSIQCFYFLKRVFFKHLPVIRKFIHHLLNTNLLSTVYGGCSNDVVCELSDHCKIVFAFFAGERSSRKTSSSTWCSGPSIVYVNICISL